MQLAEQTSYVFETLVCFSIIQHHHSNIVFKLFWTSNCIFWVWHTSTSAENIFRNLEIDAQGGTFFFVCLVSKYDKYQDRRKVIQNKKNDALHSVTNVNTQFCPFYPPHSLIPTLWNILQYKQAKLRKHLQNSIFLKDNQTASTWWLLKILVSLTM